ncbi:hypothetical protein E2C01_083551 [Portunus trituberculatus]|uniref:Uncharacterized protein n=1 Tax=Portunus trituberculatus TaxID=210409 RepID=A0A5B7J1K2_PORTR|nr:hypothetical protein [Portunus trituberculatus]
MLHQPHLPNVPWLFYLPPFLPFLRLPSIGKPSIIPFPLNLHAHFHLPFPFLSPFIHFPLV